MTFKSTLKNQFTLHTQNQTLKISQNHSVLLFDKLPCPFHFQINKNNLKNPLYQNPKIFIHNILLDKPQHTLRSFPYLKQQITLSA
nr:MAG TPA: hypothetical protein [Caudoviricetes sp.]